MLSTFARTVTDIFNVVLSQKSEWYNWGHTPKVNGCIFGKNDGRQLVNIRFSILLWGMALSFCVGPAWSETATSGNPSADNADVAFGYSLPRDAFVTFVIEDSAGNRVRNLVADAPRKAGANSETWDGRDDNGAPLPVGDYRWRGISHGEICVRWEGAFYSPGTTPWKRNQRPADWNIRASGGGGWLSDHVPPYCVFTDSSHIYLGCPIAEAGDSIIQCNLDGEKIWGQLWLGLSGAHAMCTESNVLFVASEGGWMGDRLAVNRYDIKDYRWVMTPPEISRNRVMHDSAFVREDSKDFHGIIGIYLTSDHIVLALTDKNRLSFFDRATSAWDHDEPLENIRPLIHRPSTKILRGCATDSDGNFYHCLTNGEKQCVEVLSPKGKFLRYIGKPGGRHIGKYDPMAMRNPEDVAVDAKGNVWVVENTSRPKRVSVWTREGALVREYVGTPFYGGGGSIDATGRYAYYDGMRFTLPDGELDAILTDEDSGNPSTVREFRGKTYLVADGGFGRSKIAIWEIDGYTSEKVVEVPINRQVEWSMRVGHGLEIFDRSDDCMELLVMRPDENMRYDRDKAERIPLPEKYRGFCSLSLSPEGAFIVNVGGCGNQGSKDNLFCALSPDWRKLLWSYPNPYPSNTHNSPLPWRGELRHTLGIEGFASSKIGGLMLLNGNKGTRYLFTTDGLFVTELFGDMRIRPSNRAFMKAEKGMVFSTNSLEDECFGGWFGDVDGKPCLIEGKDSLNICLLDGVETLEKLDGGKLRLDKVAKRIEDVPLADLGPLRTVKGGGFGLSRDWQTMAQYPMPRNNPVAHFAMGWLEGGHSLVLHYDVDDETPFENAGDAPHTLFHSGDALDFRWGGNIRLVMAPMNGWTVAMRYVFDDPASPDPVEFVSPAGKTKIARIEEVNDVKVNIERREGGYSANIEIPFAALGEKVPFQGGVRKVDAGVIFGDPTGTRVVRRQYLFDQTSEVVSDIPSEAKFSPETLGKFEF